MEVMCTFTPHSTGKRSGSLPRSFPNYQKRLWWQEQLSASPAAFFHFFAGTAEFFIFIVMSFDHYLATCKPLRYPTIMTSNLCLQLALSSWVVDFTIVFCQMLPLIRLPFCGDNVINHFCCDVGPILKAACTDTSILELLGLLATVQVIPGSLLFTAISYLCILSTILQIPSVTGQQKIFSTCASHLTAVSLLYGAILFMYLRPTAHSFFKINKVVSVLNTILTPLLNPFICTIRNKEVKAALRKAMACPKTHHPEENMRHIK
ncbi:olfactory receptor or14b05 [Lynx pardinus]|uniref:Olfactory receptor or14b05 n=1 Tax=Lynx pardinus TaxID=191816 RepID=A0A485PBZ6_LYNPA|nr:olfactory receptor or14b05 [Lynx pardinus]